MKLTQSTFAIILGSAVGLTAIERPGDKAAPVPDGPQGKVPGKQAAAEVAPDERVAYLGVRGEAVTEALKSHLELDGGLLLSFVDPTSPAGLAGLKQHDIILAVDDAEVVDQVSLRRAIVGHQPEDEVTLKLIRGGKPIDHKLILGEAPAVRQVPPMSLMPRGAADFNRLMDDRLRGPFGHDDLRRELMEQLEQALEFGKPGQMKELRMEFQNNGSVRFEDEKGSVKIVTEGEDRSVILRDPDGNIVFEGPYNTDEDKKAVPEEYRDRVERLDLQSGSSGFKFQFGGLPGKGD